MYLLKKENRRQKKETCIAVSWFTPYILTFHRFSMRQLSLSAVTTYEYVFLRCYFYVITISRFAFVNYFYKVENTSVKNEWSRRVGVWVNFTITSTCDIPLAWRSDRLCCCDADSLSSLSSLSGLLLQEAAGLSSRGSVPENRLSKQSDNLHIYYSE